jgi:hypothetical protein
VLQLEQPDLARLHLQASHLQGSEHRPEQQEPPAEPLRELQALEQGWKSEPGQVLESLPLQSLALWQVRM